MVIYHWEVAKGSQHGCEGLRMNELDWTQCDDQRWGWIGTIGLFLDVIQSQVIQHSNQSEGMMLIQDCRA